MTTRVVIVDDDVWVRRGRAQALTEVAGIEVVGAVGHDEALERPELWNGVDVVLVDAWDHRAGFDRFPGVGVVRAIRRHCRESPVRIIVVTGHVVNEMLRVRMAEAGADMLYGHEDVAEPDQLASVVLAPLPLASTARAQGGDTSVHPDAALDWIGAHQVEPAFTGEGQKVLPLSRRTLGHIRREVALRGGLGGPSSLPRWRQVVAFVNRARGADLPGPGTGSTTTDDGR